MTTIITAHDRSQPLVSIVIPAYNCAATIGETVDSCLSQSYPNLEVIVVNDGSTDSTAAVLRAYGSRVRVLDKANGGLASARNAGHQIASGEYIAWLDADDIAHPDRIALQVAILQHSPTTVLVCSDFSAFVTGKPDFDFSHVGTYYSSFEQRGRAPKLFERSSSIRVPCAKQLASCTYWSGRQFHNLVWGNFVHPPTVTLRKRFVDAVGPLDTTMSSGTDYEFILRLSRMGPFSYIDAPLLRYRRSDQQMSESFVHGEAWSEYRRILRKSKTLDPSFFEQHRSRYSTSMAMSYVYEAKTIGNKDRIKALRLLATSASIHLQPSAIADALLFVLTPEFVVQLVRKYRRWSRGRRAAHESSIQVAN